MNKKCIIFDVDETIADVEHRRHFVSGEKKTGLHLEKQLLMILLLSVICTIARRFIEQGR